MAERTSDFLDIVNQLTNLEIVLLDGLQACLFLETLPSNRDTLAVALTNVAPDGKLSMAMVKESPLNEEHREG